MIPRICVSILPETISEGLNLLVEAEKAEADFVEVRLDLLEMTSNFVMLVEGTELPLIATCKLVNEKGFFQGTEMDRQQMLWEAAKSGFKYVDVDLANSKQQETIEKLEPTGAKPIISYHKFDGVLSISEMKNILSQQVASGAAVCKIITTANKVEDNLDLLGFLSSNAEETRLVCFCMGDIGKISRVLSPLFGAFFTFASLEEGSETAPGQMSIREMKSVYNILGV